MYAARLQASSYLNTNICNLHTSFVTTQQFSGPRAP